MRNPIPRWSIAVLAAAVLSACSMFHHHTDYYSKAAESRPLEVPPDLDSPPSANELTVPAAGSGAANAASGVSSIPPAAGTSLSEADLYVADSTQHTWQRVGLALDRAQVGTVSAHDEAALSYTIDFNSTIETAAPAPEHHWYTRVLHPFGGGSGGGDSVRRPVKSQLTVRIAADKEGSRVSVEGSAGDKAAADAARRIIAILRERLS
jgi:uncharacterized lipoprotein